MMRDIFFKRGSYGIGLDPYAVVALAARLS